MEAICVPDAGHREASDAALESLIKCTESLNPMPPRQIPAECLSQAAIS